MKTSIARLAAALGLGLLTACGGDSKGADVSCGTGQCTVTFDRGVDGKASVLGIEAKVVSVQGDKVTVEVAGEQLTLTVGRPAAQVQGLQVTLESVTGAEIKIKISR